MVSTFNIIEDLERQKYMEMPGEKSTGLYHDKKELQELRDKFTYLSRCR